MMQSRRSVVAAAIAGALALAGGPAGAQAGERFPSKPVKIIVPFTAGGLADNLARGLAQDLSAAWGQAVVVENKPGANTIIAALIAVAPIIPRSRFISLSPAS